MEKDIIEERNFYGVCNTLEDKYTDEEMKKIKEDYFLKYEDKLLLTFFKDDDFFRNFINQISEEEREKYIENTIKYLLENQYDANYVIVARRAVPSYESKPESFWTTEAHEALYGLRNEIQAEQRLHSVIMVSTLGNLIEHGLSETIGRGESDGEIVIDPNKNFEKFLFMYKPIEEFWELEDYLKEGGITREQLLEQLRATAVERAKIQGLPVNVDGKKTIDIIEESTGDETISGINEENKYLKNRVAQKASGREESGWAWGEW